MTKSNDTKDYLDNCLLNKEDVDYKELLYHETHHNNTDAMEWIFSHKELIPNVDLKAVFNNIGKYGAAHSRKQFEILLANGYNDYINLLHKVYNKYPDFVDTFIEKIPNKETKKVEDFPKNKEDMARYLHRENHILDSYPLSTLRNIVFSNEGVNEEKRYQSTEYLKLLIYDIMDNESHNGHHSPIDYPVFNLSRGLILNINWDYLDSKGHEIIASLYNVEPTFEKVFEAQGKIIREIAEDTELSGDMIIHGVSMLTDLY